MIGRDLVWLIVIGLLVLCAQPASSASGAKIAVIVAADNPRNSINKRLLARIYRKQTQVSPRGKRIHPINLPANSPLRISFTQSIMRKTPLAMASFWNERYFHGISPPHVLSSQEAVIRFVAETPEAIGYVLSCYIDDRVKVLLTIKSNISKHGKACK